MTPCEKLGYKVGDRFIMLGDLPVDCFSRGSIIELIKDDNTDVPKFRLISGKCENGNKTSYEDLHLLQKIEENKNQYIDLCKRILSEGEWVKHERSGKRRLTVIGETFTYDVGAGDFPLDTTRKSFWKAAVAEIVGYLKGYTNANDFAALGAPTWLANANENKAWRDNPCREGDGDMGMAYRFREYDVATLDGDYITYKEKSIDQYKNIIDMLKAKKDNGRLIMSAWHPFFDDMACLPACMHTHTFSLVGDTLHLNSEQRSVDVPLGLNFNMVQCYFLLAITAQITGLKAGKVRHNMVNCHIYEDQVELMKEQVTRQALDSPKFLMDTSIQSLEDLERLGNLDNFGVTGYEYHPAIKYPFTV